LTKGVFVLEKANATNVGRFTPAETRRALEVCDSDQLAIWKPKWFSKHTGIPYGALMPFIHRYEESDNRMGIASRSIINCLAHECDAPIPRCYGKVRYYSELVQSIKKLHPALKELVQVDRSFHGFSSRSMGDRMDSRSVKLDDRDRIAFSEEAHEMLARHLKKAKLSPDDKQDIIAAERARRIAE